MTRLRLRSLPQALFLTCALRRVTAPAFPVGAVDERLIASNLAHRLGNKVEAILKHE